MFVKCINDRNCGIIWINVSKIKEVTGYYYGNGELGHYYVVTVENKEYEVAEDYTKRMEEILNGE